MKKKHIIIALGLVFTVGVSFAVGKTWSANNTSVSQLNPLEGQSFKLDIKLKEGFEKRGLSSVSSTKGEKLTHYLNCMLYNCSADVEGRSQCIGSCEDSDGRNNIVVGIQVADYGTCYTLCKLDGGSDKACHEICRRE